MDRLTAIKVFLTVAECGSFTATADKLELSRPMVSRYIALMEEWLNVRLFQRTTRHVKLTDAGEQAVRFCQQIAYLADEVEQDVAAQTGELRGVLRLTCSTSFGTSHLVQAVNRFLALHPKLQIQLDLSERSVNLVEERIDLAIRITNSPDPALFARPLASCHSLFVASPTYLAQFGEPTQPEMLAQHRCLAHAMVNKTAWKMTKAGQEVSVEINSAFTTNDALALLQAVLNDGGIAMLPKFLVDDYLAQGKLKTVLSDWQPPALTIYALYPSRHRLPIAVRTFLDFLVETFAEKDW